jgi:hypothetical protein
MSTNTQAFFIVSSGRSGTAMLHKALSTAEGCDIQHEYMVHIVQPLGVRRYMGLCDSAEAKKVLAATHIAAVRYSKMPVWGDSSNKLSWLISELSDLMPNAKFVHLVRDGRKVVGSYFRKLADECYDDRSSALLGAYVRDPVHTPAPPPEKKYWWPHPRLDDPAAVAFGTFDQFERIAWHWAEINRVILESLAKLPPEQNLFVRLEDLRKSEVEARSLVEFLGLAYRPEIYALFQRPHNVNRPEDRLLDKVQSAKFESIAGDMQKRLGYAGRAEYVVNY